MVNERERELRVNLIHRRLSSALQSALQSVEPFYGLNMYIESWVGGESSLFQKRGYQGQALAHGRYSVAGALGLTL